MARCSSSFPPYASGVYFALISAAVLALAGLEAGAQDRSRTDIFQKASFKSPTTCTVESSGAVTALVKNGVELSVHDDWDCDGVADAYDNCVGIANASQTDANLNGIGDGCESVATVSGKKEREKRSAVSDWLSYKKKKSDRLSRSAESRRSRSKSKSSDRRAPKSIKSRRERDHEKTSRKAAKTQRKKR
jgi:hypothetical protein